MSSLGSVTASSTLIPMASVNSSDDTRSSSRVVALAMSKQTLKSRMPSKKLRWQDQGGKGAPLPKRQAAKGCVFLRGAIRAYKLASQTLLTDSVSSTLCSQTRLQVDLSVRGSRTHERGELLYVPPGMDDGCLEVFLDQLSKRYPDE